MSSDVVPYGTGRRLPKAVSREMAEVKHQALIAAVKVQGIEFVARQALWAASSLSELEGQLIVQVPLSEPRLNAIVNISVAAMTEVVRDTVWGYR